MDSLVVKKKSDSDIAKQYKLVIFSGFVGKAITLKVIGLNDEGMYYRIGMNMSLKFLMNDYCQRKGFGLGKIRFIGPGGNMLKETHTPLELDMEDDNVIDAFVEHCLGKTITIKVEGLNNKKLYYRIGVNMKLKFLMNDYCKRMGFSLGTLEWFGPDGNRLIETHTPLEVELEDGDVIDAFLLQRGG